MHFQCWKSTRRRDKLLILWTLFSIQLLLIGFVLFGNNSNNLSDDIDDDSSLQAYRSNNLANPKIQRIVKFLKSDISLPNAVSTSASASSIANNNHKIVLPPLQTFCDAFFECHTGKPANFTLDSLFCFRNSSVLPISATLRQMSDAFDDDDEDCVCKCQADFHGRDCSQPEVVWRAFMTSHITKKYEKKIANFIEHEENEPKPRRIFYHIDSSALSLTTIEIQVKELHDLIDLFIFCDEIRNANNAEHGVASKMDRFRYHQQSNEHGTNFFLKKLKSKILIVETKHKCTPKTTYKMFRNQIDSLQGDEIYLYSSYDEILNRNAIQYAKWNSDWSQSQPLRFRLKYTVYGFYWQHPVQTVLGSAACQLHVLDEYYKKDPLALFNATTTGMIIGDLNHYGGWYCQYCYDSTENIAQKVQRDRTMNASMPIFTNNLITNNDVIQQQQQQQQQRSPNQIDAPHIESLISAGVYVDGKLDLIRLHRYADKYYAPDTVTKESWKYESLLTNTYAHYDGDIDE
ncbi:beta-1,4-mannosyl-glycoprotein 4-beta-N-acetylglucosaminyltransferase [Contarinia nasturtii]|uniref:beta-1,4-mannosyl-glycoprotein 4-beta-N-acetylglucosaminyltransferase n=1 Tax=Contarinia nasturtii TaxID=265458 RepID=UPI0012D4467F|nr:beta-1,4-mannosyl-glycoprotein 4-beta-N-acetylglucosaminyltransferase [Contarinia nasturtii]